MLVLSRIDRWHHQLSAFMTLNSREVPLMLRSLLVGPLRKPLHLEIIWLRLYLSLNYLLMYFLDVAVNPLMLLLSQLMLGQSQLILHKLYEGGLRHNISIRFGRTPLDELVFLFLCCINWFKIDQGQLLCASGEFRLRAEQVLLRHC